MRLRSVHPGVTVDEVVAATGFELVVPDDVPETPAPPTDDELALIHEVIDPTASREQEVPGRRDRTPALQHARAVRAVRRASCPIVQTGMGWVAGPRLDVGHERGRRPRHPRPAPR